MQVNLSILARAIAKATMPCHAPLSTFPHCIHVAVFRLTPGGSSVVVLFCGEVPNLAP